MAFIIEGQRVGLRKPTLRDVDAIFRMASHKSISAFTYVPYPYKKKHAVDFVDQAKKHWKKGTEAPMVIVLKETREVIGTCGFVQIDKDNKSAEMGYWMGVPFRGNGYATEAATLLLKYGFRTRKLRRIYANVFATNTPSTALLKKLGFVLEGTLRKTEKRGGRYLDEHVFAILKEEYN